MKLFVVLTASLCGCTTFRVPTPPVAVETPNGEVRAETFDEAMRVAADLQELAPKLKELLRDTNDRPVHVYVLDEFLPENRDGGVYEGKILLCRNNAAAMKVTLSHELVHWSSGDSWAVLPCVVREGVADLISAMLSEEWGTTVAATRAMSIQHPAHTDPKVVLRMSDEELSAANAREGKLAYGVGFIVANEIGIDGLHALCVRARDEGLKAVPLDWLFEAGHLSATDMREWPIRDDVPPLPTHLDRAPE